MCDVRISACAAGQLLFEEFLRTEYSEENLLFWLACEEYKKIFSKAEMAAAAKRIYVEFVQVDAPRQVRLPRFSLLTVFPLNQHLNLTFKKNNL